MSAIKNIFIAAAAAAAALPLVLPLSAGASPKAGEEQDPLAPEATRLANDILISFRTEFRQMEEKAHAQAGSAIHGDAQVVGYKVYGDPYIGFLNSIASFGSYNQAPVSIVSGWRVGGILKDCREAIPNDLDNPFQRDKFMADIQECVNGAEQFLAETNGVAPVSNDIAKEPKIILSAREGVEALRKKILKRFTLEIAP